MPQTSMLPGHVTYSREYADAIHALARAGEQLATTVLVTGDPERIAARADAVRVASRKCTQVVLDGINQVRELRRPVDLTAPDEALEPVSVVPSE